MLYSRICTAQDWKREKITSIVVSKIDEHRCKQTPASLS